MSNFSYLKSVDDNDNDNDNEISLFGHKFRQNTTSKIIMTIV